MSTISDFPMSGEGAATRKLLYDRRMQSTRLTR